MISVVSCGSPWLRATLVAGTACFALALGASAQTPGGEPRGPAPTPIAGGASATPASPDAPGTVADAVASPDGALPPGEEEAVAQEMSIWQMFSDAGLVAKSVMVLLLLASVWNISILLEKTFVLRRVNNQADRFLKAFRSAKTLEDLSRGNATNTGGPMSRMFAAGMQEYHLTFDHGPVVVSELRERIRERIADTMRIVQSHETRELGSSMSVLATIGSTAPFIGLFGTVWGIMTSFIGIAQKQTTNLAVVAPGIAEALLATAIGLAAAIPAVMIYNKFSRDIGQFSGRLEDFSTEFAVVLSRELDQREVA